MAILIAGMWYFDGRIHPQRNLFDFVFLPVIVVLTVRTVLRKARKDWDSLVLEFCEDRLVRKSSNWADIEIAPGEVTALEDSARGVMIKTDHSLKSLFVSKYLLDYDDFRNRLAAWAPTVRVVRKEPSVRSFLAVAISLLGCMLMFFSPIYLMYTSHHELVLPLGAVLIVLFTVVILYVRRSPYIPASRKNSLWLLLSLPLLAMIFRAF